MSIQSTSNNLIALAREWHMRHRGKSWKARAAARRGALPLSRELVEELLSTGYFNEEAARVFGDALEVLLQTSTPSRTVRKTRVSINGVRFVGVKEFVFSRTTKP